MKRYRLFFAPLLMSLLFAGCAGAPVAKRERIFFPPLPDRPRIEFIDAYQSQHNFAKTSGQLTRESIFGREPDFAFGRPLDVASCGDGKVYISDTLQDRVFVYDFNKKTVAYLTGEASFQNPTGLTTDGDCNLYVVNTKLKKVYVFDRNGKPYFSFGGEEVFKWPVGIAVDDERGHIYVSDARKHDVLVFDKKGNALYSMLETGAKDAAPVDVGFNFPLDLEVASDGRVVVLDAMNARIKVYSPEGEFLTTWGERGDGWSRFGMPKGIAIDTDDNLYVTDADTGGVKIFRIDGTPLSGFGSKFPLTKPGRMAAGGFQLVSGIDIDPKGGIYVADQLNKNFQVFQFLTDEYLKEHPLPVYKPEEIEKGAGWDDEEEKAETKK